MKEQISRRDFVKASGALALRRQVHAPKAGIFLERGEWVSIQSLFLS